MTSREPLMVSDGGIPYNKAHLDAKDKEIARLREELDAKLWHWQKRALAAESALAKSEEARETAEQQAFSLAETALKFEALTEAAESSLSQALARIEELEKAAWFGGIDNERLCDAAAMRQWETSLKRSDLAEKDRVRGAIEAFKRQAIALEMRPATPIDGGDGQ